MRNIDYINSVVSSELGIPKNIVEAVNKEYWRSIKSSMNNMSHTSLYLKNIGTFSASKYLMNKKIKETIKKIRKIRKSERLTELKKSFIIENYYNTLRKLLFQRNEVAKLYYESTRRNKGTYTASPEE